MDIEELVKRLDHKVTPMDEQEQALIRSLVEAELSSERQTQESWCRVAAAAAIVINGGPFDLGMRWIAAEGLARGLFGEAFTATGEGTDHQRAIWILMCDTALEDVAQGLDECTKASGSTTDA